MKQLIFLEGLDTEHRDSLGNGLANILNIEYISTESKLDISQVTMNCSLTLDVFGKSSIIGLPNVPVKELVERCQILPNLNTIKHKFIVMEKNESRLKREHDILEVSSLEEMNSEIDKVIKFLYADTLDTLSILFR